MARPQVIDNRLHLDSFFSLRLQSIAQRLRIATPEVAGLSMRQLDSGHWECVLRVATVDAPTLTIRREGPSKGAAVASVLQTVALVLMTRQQAKRIGRRRDLGEVSQ